LRKIPPQTYSVQGGCCFGKPARKGRGKGSQTGLYKKKKKEKQKKKKKKT